MKVKPKKIVVSKTPYRLCLGGGSDLIPYVKRYGGHALSATVNKYVTIVARRRDDPKINFHYALGTESADSWRGVEHPYVRAILKHIGLQGGVEIASFTDVPFASGLGSSGAFTVGLLNALWALQGVRKSPRALAEEAAYIELKKLKSPIGKHDQYMAAFGGLCDLRFMRDGAVRVRKITYAPRDQKKFEDHLLLVHSGMIHSATRQLSPLFAKLTANDRNTVDAMHDFRTVGVHMADLLHRRDFINYGRALAALGMVHKKLVPSHERMDALVKIGEKSGAMSGMASGSGGGGFILFVCPHRRAKDAVATALVRRGASVHPFHVTHEGSKIIFSA
jgi:D-glycero-alpha-D-manno-heptose-7-phosphate kinase